ncbi:putative quinol monooxygenase [Neorhizobium sp. LjRoot104]|uniref:putative quinol monooxygenase n=1 Tax=Neorhizobium sp. LjRoot104 TaxID=3342254 RepID=UPI003ECD0DD3
MTDTLTLIARLTAKPDLAEMLGEALQSIVSPTRAEAGSIDYHLHRDSNDPTVWILLCENWRSRAQSDAHFQQPCAKAVMARFPDLPARDMELTF